MSWLRRRSGPSSSEQGANEPCTGNVAFPRIYPDSHLRSTLFIESSTNTPNISNTLDHHFRTSLEVQHALISKNLKRQEFVFSRIKTIQWRIFLGHQYPLPTDTDAECVGAENDESVVLMRGCFIPNPADTRPRRKRFESGNTGVDLDFSIDISRIIDQVPATSLGGTQQSNPIAVSLVLEFSVIGEIYDTQQFTKINSGKGHKYGAVYNIHLERSSEREHSFTVSNADNQLPMYDSEGFGRLPAYE